MDGQPGLKAMSPIRPGSTMGSYVLGSITTAVMPGNPLPMDPGLTSIPGTLVIMMAPVSVCQYVS